MKLVIVDIYGDGKNLCVLPDTPGIEVAIEEFKKIDKEFVEAIDHDDAKYHGGFQNFMSKRGFVQFLTRTIILD